MSAATTLFPPEPLTLQVKDGKIYSYVRRRWLVQTPEETVRQQYLLMLVNEYGYQLDQIKEEESALGGRGTGGARYDFAIWLSAQDKATPGTPPLIIVECKANNITISEQDYMQGEAYARLMGTQIFVTHNHRETRYWKVLLDKTHGHRQEIENIPKAGDSNKEREALLKKLRTFREDEFANVLRDCHNIIRNRDHLDPTAAFDEIAKVLFVKVFVEREMRAKRASKNLFTVEVLEQQIGEDPLNILFEQTKKVRKSDRLFKTDERIMLKPETSKAIVKRLEVYNLSDTSEDVKGIAFEKFLGRTFRGEIGQFFTPRTIVEFMIRMVAPQEGEVILDPAAGSGGFLIRAFELMREQILADADRAYETEKLQIAATPGLKEADKGRLLQEAFARIQHDISVEREGGRLWHLANRCLYGTDANDRMARTAKMNMIMHGDGHGGVHHHDGLLNVNGIFEGRFHVILTNPPFGSSVEPTAKVLPNQVELAPEDEERYLKIYGEPYRVARAQQQDTLNKPIANLFDLGRGPSETKPLKQKTEILFIERCLNLLAPGGRLAVVLPEGIFNNPSLEAVRHHCEGRARLLAVVSLPADTFLSSGATVKCSLLFARKFSEAEALAYAAAIEAARTERSAHHAPAREAELSRLDDLIQEAQATKQREELKLLRAERAAYEKRLAALIEREARPLVKQRLDYPVFLYEAERVGINATGEPDLNELYPNATPLHPGEPTALELYQQFTADPAAFAAAHTEAEPTV